MTHSSTSRGFTMVELLTVVTIIAISASLAAPVFRSSIERVRVRGALDLLVGEIYRARISAVQEGRAVQLFLVADGDGCTRALRLQKSAREGPSLSSSSKLDLPGLCLRHSGDSVVAFNGRGMLRPPTRSFFISHGLTADSVVISIAGRVRRSYRHRKGKEILSASGNKFRPRFSRRCAKCLRNNKIRAGTDFTSPDRCGSARARLENGLEGPSDGPLSTPVRPPPGGRTSPDACRINFAERHRRRPSRRSFSGFSLIEILVAMVIISVGIMGLQAVAMSAVRSVAMADRNTRYAAHASDSLEAALYRLRTGSVPSQLCTSLPPFGDQLSRRITLAGQLATVTIAITPSPSYRPSPRLPLELSSSIFVPGAPAAPGAMAGSPCS